MGIKGDQACNRFRMPCRAQEMGLEVPGIYSDVWSHALREWSPECKS